jgi:hypothetical protein
LQPAADDCRRGGELEVEAAAPAPAAALERRPGLRADDAVDGETVRALVVAHRLLGQRAEQSVNLMVLWRVSRVGEQLLGVADPFAARPSPEGRMVSGDFVVLAHSQQKCSRRAEFTTSLWAAVGEARR